MKQEANVQIGRRAREGGGGMKGRHKKEKNRRKNGNEAFVNKEGKRS